LAENGKIKIITLETMAGEEYQLYLKVLRNLIDDNVVKIEDDVIYLDREQD
jgi:hypothetical protein